MGGPHEWPRPIARDEVAWERYSAAVLSAGLNLKLDIEPQRWDLPTINIYPPFLSATPYFGLAAGVQWRHSTNYLLADLRDKINEGLSGADQLTDADFLRDMHDFQAPDLSAETAPGPMLSLKSASISFLASRSGKSRSGRCSPRSLAQC